MHKSQSTATSLGSGKGWNAQNLQTSLICWPKYDLYRGSLWFSYSLFLVFLFSIFFLEHTRLQMDLEKVEQVRRNIKYMYFPCYGFGFLHYLIDPPGVKPLHVSLLISKTTHSNPFNNFLAVPTVFLVMKILKFIWQKLLS